MCKYFWADLNIKEIDRTIFSTVNSLAYELHHDLYLKCLFIDVYCIIPLRLYKWLGKRVCKSLTDEMSDECKSKMSVKRFLITDEVEAQKKEIERQKDQMKELIAKLEEQTAATQKIAQKYLIKLSY